ncbi:MAG: hypothetical protein ALECFALPRED_004996 [Alectoria fallacina]|uniref:Uncharacterized protein n=1 Tax=Alectoria fallacina TaxID=1903189 RepID=A0A8H3FV09_9LECA|nr:MAG: hypothetical protein ALECFALPRED_004996 [Alectoria fallacina]
MFYASVVCLSWAIVSLPLIHCVPLGGPEPLQLVDVVGAPTDDVSCPVPLKPNTNQYFTAGYVTGNIADIVRAGKTGSYPKPFNPNSDKADQFSWDLNDCGTRQTNGETILELPMFIDSTNNNEETYWSKNPASNNNKPGPYREYYIIKSNGASSASENTATYCGAYAHKDLTSNGDFVVCT